MRRAARPADAGALPAVVGLEARLGAQPVPAGRRVTRGVRAGLLALALGGCDTEVAPLQYCPAETAVDWAVAAAPLTRGNVAFDPVTCERCVCAADGTRQCERPPVCVPPDLGAPDGAAADSAVADGGDPPLEDAGAPGDAAGCTAADNTCLDPATAQRCLADGTLRTLACGPDERCIGDTCSRPRCAAEALFCSRGERRRCVDGFDSVAEPCAEGEICAEEGRCSDPQPNVLLLVDTSGSMNDPVGPVAALPFPTCEDPAAPYTRMGLVKQALAHLFTLEAAQPLRLALQRFPQTVRSLGLCGPGHYQAQDTLRGHTVETAVDRAVFLAGLRDIVAVPFTADGALPLAELQRWVDFDEVFERTGARCDGSPESAAACPGVCEDGRCLAHAQPELRAQGATPIGRSLFYAGEYLRHGVLREGLACGDDADCDSPHYTCQAGRCHDPLYACRPSVVILFTDGGESEFREETSFFNPVVQAGRLRAGLTCAQDSQCMAPARCLDGRCSLGRCAADASVVCGSADDCGGAACTLADPPAAVLPGRALVTHPGGRQAPVTVHVIDAAGGFAGNARTALWGGGTYQRLVNFDVDSLVAVLVPLLDTKALLERCLAD